MQTLRKNYSFINQMESSWTDYYGTGTISFDTSDYMCGSASVKIVASNDGSHCGARHTLSPSQDWTNRTLKLWIKVDDWSTVSEVSILVSTSGSYTSYFKLMLSQFMTYPTDHNNEWVECIIPQSQFTVGAGSPTWTTVNDLMVRVYGIVGQTPTVHFDEFATINNPSNGKLSIVFDDGHVSQSTTAQPILDGYGYKGTAFIIPNYVGTTNYMSQSQIDQLAQKGWDISGHGDTNLVSLSPTSAETAVQAARTYLDGLGYKGSQLFAYPNGGENPTVRGIVEKYFNIARTIVNMNQPVNYVDNTRVLCHNVHNTDSVASIKSWIDNAKNNNEHLVLLFHKIVTTPTIAIEYATADFQTIIDYANSSGLSILPLSDSLLNQ